MTTRSTSIDAWASRSVRARLTNDIPEFGDIAACLLEVQVMVEAASRIEGGTTVGAAAHGKVGVDRHRLLADAAQDRVLTATPPRPLPGGMLRGLLVAEVTGIEAPAAGELDRDHIRRRRVVSAPGLLVDRLAEDLHGHPPLSCHSDSGSSRCAAHPHRPG